jgi:hypothetical protein
MKIFLITILFSIALFGAKVVEVEERFQKSQSCKACHLHLVKDWENSWHAKSHYKSDEYFKATIDYVSRKTRKSLNGVKVQCATCHNPRISVTSTNMDYEIAAVMGLDKGSKVNKALKSDAINEGINCVVCHNIDEIHVNADKFKRGINRIEWTKSGLMSGPYDDAKSPYHKVEYREFMNEKSNDLCFVCHANDSSVGGLKFMDMESEYKKDKKLCVDCHMGPKELGVAATLKIDHGKARQRKIRAHTFNGGHVEEMWKGVLNLEMSQMGKDIILLIENPQPHNIPSGFGARELVIDLIYKNGSKEIASQTVSLTTHYTSKREKPTIPHLAVKASKDMSIPAKGKRTIKVPKVDGATSLEAKIFYRLVNDEVREILKLKAKTWSKKNFITSKTIELQ